ncbi:MAG TPA: hypothetical protein VMQ62_11715, partial [Dongiaceae bacterium]|nr:hypothetical protein [Dongiaceae bacterium]
MAALALTLCGAVDAVTGQAPPPSGGALGRAEALVQSRTFEPAADLLRDILAADPRNRRAQELLAFVLESRGDRAGERRVRAALAAEYPDDPRAQADYGRVLERSGRTAEALAAYRRARSLRPGLEDPALDAAIERTRGRTAVEVATPIRTMSDPDAIADRAQAGAAVPFGSLGHLTLLAARADAESRQGSGNSSNDLLAATLVLQRPSGASFAAGPLLHEVALDDGVLRDDAVGGAIAAQGPLGAHLVGDLNIAYDAPWEEAAVAMLHGGRVTTAEGHLYAHFRDRRLLLQIGAQGRRLSILTPEAGAADPGQTDRPGADQNLAVAGADVVVWRRAGVGRGDILDDALVAPVALPTAIVAGYRHYEVSTTTTPEFAEVIDLAPRGAVSMFRQRHGLTDGAPLVAILPGSRPNEVSR